MEVIGFFWGERLKILSNKSGLETKPQNNWSPTLFPPTFQYFYTDISAISVTFCNSVHGKHFWSDSFKGKVLGTTVAPLKVEVLGTTAAVAPRGEEEEGQLISENLSTINRFGSVLITNFISILFRSFLTDQPLKLYFLMIACISTTSWVECFRQGELIFFSSDQVFSVFGSLGSWSTLILRFVVVNYVNKFNIIWSLSRCFCFFFYWPIVEFCEGNAKIKLEFC